MSLVLLVFLASKFTCPLVCVRDSHTAANVFTTCPYIPTHLSPPHSRQLYARNSLAAPLLIEGKCGSLMRRVRLNTFLKVYADVLTQEIGVALTTFGGLFMLLGVMLFFDGALLALGNVRSR
jgi:hypothetical protein